MPFLFQSISLGFFPSATTWQTISAADVFPVAIISWNAKGFVLGKFLIVEIEDSVADDAFDWNLFEVMLKIFMELWCFREDATEECLMKRDMLPR